MTSNEFSLGGFCAFEGLEGFGLGFMKRGTNYYEPPHSPLHPENRLIIEIPEGKFDAFKFASNILLSQL